MTLSDKFTYYILCEDKQMQCFWRYFLQSQNINRRKINSEPLPVDGCGEQYVREQLPKKIVSYFKIKNFNNTVLVVSTDADTKTVAERKKTLLKECENKNSDVNVLSECILWFIPKRNIETWIEYFSSGNPDSINEENDYPHIRKHEADCKPAAEKMSSCFQKEEGNKCALPSLQTAYGNFEEVVSLQKKRLAGK